ncbi:MULTISPECIES: restriction endonuclease subunit S [Enterobacter cloacae complex]|uniref:restriction endonuclease subunit S n=1 Tax=Enterobacter cloacae complex TaxID=354276 RepID=UPI002075E2C8|nr:restriction endonuclease subunit S [Enterobacter roggenkampii]MCM7332980.1 restriction endonuclease subunit S [Enterobacter roggenkampii]
MSELSYLEKLLDGVEVEWRNLGDTSLFEIANNGRKPVKASLRIAGETPYYGANNIQDYVDGYTHDGEYVLIAEDGSASLENYSIQYATGKFWANNHVHVVRGKERVHSRFLYHYLCIVNFLPFLTGGGRAKLTKGQLIEIPVPIPCPDNPEKSLAIQSEIVRILDKFTALTAELTAELNMRKKQYNHYRDQLLSFEGGSVEWKSLGEVAIITIGAFVRKDKQNPDADYPVYNGGRTPTGYYEDFNNDGDKIIVSARGANAGFVNKSSTPYWAGNSCYSISVRSTEQLHWMYVYYYLKQSETKLTGIQQKGGIPAVSKKQMEDLLLPIPSKSEQVRIVTILDKFDTLTSSITEGLPREIELRQKQYEYYRDLLFSFPKHETTSN